MEKDEDPTVYIAQMEGKQARMTSAGLSIDDDNFFLHIIGNLPNEYDIEAHEFELIMDDATKTLKMEYMKNRLKA